MCIVVGFPNHRSSLKVNQFPNFSFFLDSLFYPPYNLLLLMPFFLLMRH
uniref:Uncharacterized protein n=1 Tax=Rhizophora mucronata TaxID=61149 RepID=A0A2P2JJ12_RHIMU